jgi:hypothetical protein
MALSADAREADVGAQSSATINLNFMDPLLCRRPCWDQSRSHSWILKRNLVVAVDCEPTSEDVSDFLPAPLELAQTGELQMTKIKTLGATVLLVAAVAAPVFAQGRGGVGSEPSSSVSTEMPSMNSGIRNRELNEPGDFAVTGGLPDTSRVWNPTGQVDPGTSNSPAGNAGGE